MNIKEYQELAMRTNDRKCTDRLSSTIDKVIWETLSTDIGGIINASLGLSGEVGELNDMIKKWVFHGHDIDMQEVKKELGDICWYVAMMCESFGFDLEEVMELNIDKLKKRYPEGFSEQASINREG